MKIKIATLIPLFFIFIMHHTIAQQKNITGTVIDNQGLPLPGVNVIIKNSTSGTQTDFDGNYSISADANAVLVFSFVGFKTKEVNVNSRAKVDVKLEENTAELDEVVVTAYGTSRKSNVSSSISTVSTEDIENYVPTTSIDNILQGQAAGVQVTAANGRPGNTAFVQIRGVGSINATTTPLYVIDGVPVPINESENFNPLNNINPSDIKSVSILKDAASASKYGSRGANGVVLITTKKGKSGEAKISFTSSYGFGERIPDPFDLMNASQKLEIERQYAQLGVNAALALPGNTSTPEQLEQLISFDTNWEDELLRRSILQNNNLSISGGSERLTYYYSMAYSLDTGIIDRIDGFERISGRLNTTYQAKDWLSISTNVSASRNSTDLPRDRNNAQNPFRAMYDYNPYAPLYARDSDGDFLRDDFGNLIFNTSSNLSFPIARALTTELEDVRNFLLIGNVSASITFSEKFSNTFSVGAISNRFSRTSRSLPGGVLNSIVGDVNFPGNQTENRNSDLEYNVNNLFTYRDTFGGNHNLTASFLLEYNENIRNELFVSGRGFPSPNIPFLDVAAEATNLGSNEARRILYSQALFADYDYDGKYIASVSLRRDGSSRFGPDNKYGTFYSGSLAWNIAKEDFMNGSIFNTLKFRGSYGTSGNQNIPDFQYIDLADFTTYNGFTALRPLRLGNPNIKWEAQAILDLGLEFGMFNNKINGVIDYFNKNSLDLLINQPISQTTGDEDNAIFSNIGEVRNSGFEISLNATVFQNNDWNISVGGNALFLDNEVVKLKDGEDIVRGSGFGNSIILREGEEINSFYLVEYVGVNPNNGAPLYLDSNGNETSTFSEGAQNIISGKSPIPEIQGGFYTSIQYKGFGLRGDFVYRTGNYILNFQRADGVAINRINANLRTEAFNYWKEPGDTGVLPSPFYQLDSDQTSTRFLEKGDFLRLRTLTLDYNMPAKYLEKLPISSLRIFATGQNILTFTNYEGDPEIGLGSAETSQPGDQGFVANAYSLYSYPQIRSYIFGLEVGF